MALQHRYSEPVALQRVWKAIEFIRGQRQIANIARLTKVIQREYPYKLKEIMQHILRAVRDNMVIETLSVGCKGSKAGLEQEGYWIPEESDILKLPGTHDWYCFNCHKPGELLKCTTCSKVYHIDCIEAGYEPKEAGRPENFCCKFCSKKKEAEPPSFERKRDLNKCLGFIIERTAEYTPQLLQQPKPEDYMHFKYFIREHKTLGDIADACSRQVFDSVDDLLSQIQRILHNCTILLGEEGNLTKEAKNMYDACERELNELTLCPNCYLLSSTKPTKDWFCAPCNPPHKVVWAKQKGFEYWPAKVIQNADGKLDVRFFGGHHERAWVKLHYVKSIVVSPTELNVKKTKGWIKASDEMKRYITEVEKNLGLEHAENIVKFDAKAHETPKEGDTSVQTQAMEVRSKKRKAEMDHLIAIEAKRKEVVTPNEPSTSKECPAPHTNTKQSLVQYLIKQSSNQVKAFGQKAKLNHECARTWPFATDCILINRNGNKRLREQGHRTLSKGRVEKCDCRRIYSRKLFMYKSTVRRLRLKERRDNLMISAFYIQRYLRKHTSNYLALQEENAKLKSENEELKARLQSPSADTSLP